jgi:hypothetical protein
MVAEKISDAVLGQTLPAMETMTSA